MREKALCMIELFMLGGAMLTILRDHDGSSRRIKPNLVGFCTREWIKPKSLSLTLGAVAQYLLHLHLNRGWMAYKKLRHRDTYGCGLEDFLQLCSTRRGTSVARRDTIVTPIRSSPFNFLPRLCQKELFADVPEPMDCWIIQSVKRIISDVLSNASIERVP